jgi:probable F420-dependent oxidoreductase
VSRSADERERVGDVETALSDGGEEHAHHLEVSLGLWQDRPAAEVIDTALLADRLQYRSVWIGEMATWDAFALGAHLAGQFQHSSLVLGPFAVAVRDPAMIAIGVASVAALARRPVSVALGTSSTTVVENWHGRSRRRSGAMLAESAQALRQLLDGEKVNFDGEVIRSWGYRLRLPAPSSELVIAAFGDQALNAAAAFADRLVLNLVDPSSVADLTSKIQTAADATSRPRPRVAVWMTCAVNPSAAGVEQVRRGVTGYLSAPGYSEMFRRAGFGDVVDFALTRPHPSDLLSRIPVELVRVTGLLGDESQIANRIQEYIDAGADDIVIVPSATDDDPAGEGTLRAMIEVGTRLFGAP